MLRDGLHWNSATKFSVGETVEIMKPDGRNVLTKVEGIWDLDGNAQESAPHAKQALRVKLTQTPDQMDILRRKDDSAN